MAFFVRSPVQPCENGASALEADEELLLEVDGVACSVARAEPAEGRAHEAWGGGSLRVTSKRILWRRSSDGDAAAVDGDALAGFAVKSRHIGLHAVTRDPETFPAPCLYAQLLLDDFPPDASLPTEIFFARPLRVPPKSAVSLPLRPPFHRRRRTRAGSRTSSRRSRARRP